MEKSESDFTINTSSFPGKLWYLVNDPQITSVCWDPSGDGVLIYENSFSVEVLKSHTRLMKTHFKTSNFSSFIRQMNLYGFKKVRPATDILSQVFSVCLNMDQPHHFQNPNFKEAKPELLVHIKRLTHMKKTKIVPDIEVPSQSPRRMNYAKAIKSLKEKSAEMSMGSLLVESPITPHQSSPQSCNRIPESLYELESSVSCVPHSDGNPYWNSGYVPDPSQSDLDMELDTLMQVAEELQESSVGYNPHSDGNPDWNSGFVPDPWQSDLDMDLDTLLQVAEELQDVPEGGTDISNDLEKNN